LILLTERKPFWGVTPANQRKATFPDLTVTVEQDQNGWIKDPALRTRAYNIDTVPPFIACENPRCKNGGLDLYRVLHTNGDGVHLMVCPGHEGYIRGRQKGPKCDNHFRITVSL
jgi:hypothetical protein